MDGIGPDQLRLTELLRRVKEGDVREVIVATNPTAQGEATALYIARLLQAASGVTVTRIARGVPMGSDPILGPGHARPRPHRSQRDPVAPQRTWSPARHFPLTVEGKM